MKVQREEAENEAIVRELEAKIKKAQEDAAVKSAARLFPKSESFSASGAKSETFFEENRHLFDDDSPTFVQKSKPKVSPERKMTPEPSRSAFAPIKSPFGDVRVEKQRGSTKQTEPSALRGQARRSKTNMSRNDEEETKVKARVATKGALNAKRDADTRQAVDHHLTSSSYNLNG